MHNNIMAAGSKGSSADDCNKMISTMAITYKNDNQFGQFGNQMTMNVAEARENVGSSIVQHSGIQCFNCKEFRHFAKECRKPKGLKTPHTDEEVDEQELEAHYNYMAKIQEVPTADSDTDFEPVEQNDQNDVESDDERVALANLKLDNKQTEFEKYKAFNDRTIDYEKLELVKEKHDELIKQSLLTKSHYEGLVKQKTKEMHADLTYVESLEKEIYELESDKANFSNMYDMILQECVSKDVMCSYFLSLSDLDALDELQCLYLHKLKECDCLAQKLSKQTESVNKEVHTELLQRFAKVEKHSISFEIALQKYLKAQLQDKNIAISELKKLIEKGKGKSVDTKFDKPSVVRQPNAQRIPKPSVLGVNHNTNVSRPHRKSNQLKDKVVPNNSQMKLKKTQVEVHPRILSVSNKMKSVTTRKDGLNSRTLNANAICATCNKCLVDSNHFACVTKMLNDVNARTKKPNVVPISTRKPKSQANKSVATSHKNKVASKSTNQKPQRYFRMLYEQTTKRSSFKSKVVPSSKGGLNLLHMDLCGPMRVASINEKKYILVIVDDYSRYTWTLFLRSKDETPEVLKEFLTRIQRNLQAPVITVRTDRGTEDGKNLDKMKEKMDMCILVGYSTQSKGYRVYNKRTRMIVESIHIRFDEIKEVSETFVANETSGLVPQRKKASDYDNPDPVPQRQDVSSSEDAHVPSQQELDLIFGPLYDEFFNASSNPKDTQPTMNIQPTSAPSTSTYVHAEENNDDQAEEEHLPDDKFTNPLCAPPQEVAESSSHNIDLEMCMFALTVSTAEPKNIKEAMADSAWIKALQEELHQFDDIVFGTSDPPIPTWYLYQSGQGSSFVLIAFSDAGHGRCINSRKSTSRGIQFLGDKLVSWMSKKQNCTAMSSAKAEYHSRTKNIHTRYHFIKEQVKNGIIELYFVRTEYQLADMFTKALPEDMFKYLVRRIGMRCLTPVELEVLANESA
nr:hypothetical protein [Tanacetum cinerariifolium]